MHSPRVLLERQVIGACDAPVRQIDHQGVQHIPVQHHQPLGQFIGKRLGAPQSLYSDRVAPRFNRRDGRPGQYAKDTSPLTLSPKQQVANLRIVDVERP